MVDISIFSFGKDGHRAHNLSVLELLLDPSKVRLVDPGARTKIDFFPTLDDSISTFIRASIIGALTNRRVVGLFFRPRQCFVAGKAKYTIKRLLFIFLKRIPRTRILTIIPFDVDPRFELVASGWIHDPQLWDLGILEPSQEVRKKTAISQEIQRLSKGRRIVVALGGQHRSKGFDKFVRLWLLDESVRARFAFVSAGKVADDVLGEAREFELAGGVLIDRYVSHDELLDLYSIADIVWSCYAPDYDQASGIFGRAFQLGKPTIIRDGSYLGQLAEWLNHPVLAVPFDDAAKAGECLVNWNPKKVDQETLSAQICRMRKIDLAKLLDAFGIEASI